MEAGSGNVDREPTENITQIFKGCASSLLEKLEGQDEVDGLLSSPGF